MVTRGGGKEGLLFVNKKKQKNFLMALRAKDFVTARSALGGLETLPSPPARRCKANEVFARFFSKSAACLPMPAC
jgi:hypothetical protein